MHALVYDVEGPAVIMKRVSGRTWDELIEASAPLEQHIEVALQVCQAVAFAHSRGVLHRDIKPDNIMIGDFGEVYLLDWGVAQRVEDADGAKLAGTPAYMAPEMTRGRVDIRSDVFLLGASLHHAVTGEARHGGRSILEAVAAAMRCQPYAYGPAVPDELAAVLGKACARHPDDRYPTVNALRAALLAFREHRAASQLVSSAQARAQRLVALAADPAGADYSHAQALFTETRFAFEQAREVWAEHQGRYADLRDAHVHQIEGAASAPDPHDGQHDR